MTRKEAIQWYETKLAVNERCGLCGPQNEAAKLALAALREQEERMTNLPLTLDELRKMQSHGQVVWLAPLLASESLAPQWWILKPNKTGRVDGIYLVSTSRRGNLYNLTESTYGKTWLAYRNKPEEVRHEN